METIHQPSATERQREIYLAGFKGKNQGIPAESDRLKSIVQEKVRSKAWAYLEGAAGNESTMKANREVFDNWKIVPRMMKDVSSPDLSVTLFDIVLPSPLLLAPIGVLELVHQQADLAVARAAGKLGIPMLISNQASVAMEICSMAMGHTSRWFQLYWSKSEALVESLVKRAEKCGCAAIVVTLDTTMLGWRPRDLRSGYLPFLEGKGIAQYVSDPIFQQLLAERKESLLADNQGFSMPALYKFLKLCKKYPGSFFSNFVSKTPLAAVRLFTDIYSNPSLNWDHIKILRKITKLPVILKGILHPDDAMKALDHGVDAIIVSNHGGRQVDGAIPSLLALKSIKEKTGDKIPLLIDSGIRTGADIFKALALGAVAVCIGRPYVYGLALKGETGVAEVVINLLSDFELTMRLSGINSISDINEDCLYYDR